MFRPERLELARMQVDVNYHMAFTYWSLKGVIAERWGHGPLFGSFVDQGNQVTLTPAITDGTINNRVQAYYGIAASGFNAEPATDREALHRDAVSWITEVLEVLKPQHVVRVHATFFGLYPITNADRASEKLRERFYQQNELVQLLPDRKFPEFHSAVETILVDGPEQLTFVIGAVGPPHKGVYFATPNAERDDRWWMGVRVTGVVMREEDGISAPASEVDRLLTQTYRDYTRVALRALPSVV